MNKVARHATALMLALTLGLHWTVLQSVAWMTMLVSYSAESSLGDAVVKTFDGQHPCKLCIAVDEGRKTEREHKDHQLVLKLDWWFEAETVFFFKPAPERVHPCLTLLPEFLATAPPKPPPRLA